MTVEELRAKWIELLKTHNPLRNVQDDRTQNFFFRFEAFLMGGNSPYCSICDGGRIEDIKLCIDCQKPVCLPCRREHSEEGCPYSHPHCRDCCDHREVL